MRTQDDLGRLSRRDFVRLASLSGTALMAARILAACSTQAAEPSTPSPSPQSSATGPGSADGPPRPPTATATPERPTESQRSPTWTDTPPSPEAYLPDYAGCSPSCPLPPPRTESGIPLMRAFSLRASRRLFRPQPLPLQIVSELLWAAFGVNRPASGGRTAPSAYGAEDIDVYLATGGGLLRYAANGHRLLPVRPDDLRAATGSQPFVAAAPLDLVYVSDSARLAAAGIAAGEQAMFSWAHSGFIAQNVYLFCASEGLASVVRSTIDREALAARMGLASTQQITLAQTVGYPG